VRSDDHDHVAAVLARRTLDATQFGDVLREALQQPEAHLGAGLLTSAEHDHHLDLVPRLEEPLDVPLLGGVVVRVDLQAEADLLEDRVRLVLAGFAGLHVGLVLELAEVHELADRRSRRRSDLDEVEACFVRQPQRVLDAHDADLFAVGAHEPHLGNTDAVVDAGLADVLLLRRRGAAGHGEGPRARTRDGGLAGATAPDVHGVPTRTRRRRAPRRPSGEERGPGPAVRSAPGWEEASASRAGSTPSVPGPGVGTTDR
jgi:hypothetical protein